MGEGKEGIQRQQCRDVHQHPGREAKGKNSDQGGSEEEMPTLETAFLSYPLLHPLAHADKAVCPSVPALLVGDPALPRRQPALCSGTERVLGSLTLLCSLISTRLLQIPRDEREGRDPVRWWAWGPLGAYPPCCRARKEKAAGSSAELKVLVTHSNGGSS